MKKSKSKKPVLKKEKTRPVKTKFSQLLLDKGVTLIEISRATNISYPVLIDLKKGTRGDFNSRTLSQISTYLKVDVNEIIDLTQNGKKETKKTGKEAGSKATTEAGIKEKADSKSESKKADSKDNKDKK